MDRRSVLIGVGSGLLSGFVPWAGAQTIRGQKLKGFIRTNWSRDPFSYGSYSYIAKGAKRRHYRRLAQPIGSRLFFAGEATHPKYNSTVHAAYESGQRAAALVLEERHRNVAILGAGMSGLSAAHKLAGEGLEVTVFEARDRIGGRVWTDHRLGLALDLGASWIHGTDGNPLTSLADSIGQQRVSTDDSSINRGRDGRVIRDRDLPGWIENVVYIQHSAGADTDQINIWAYLSDADYGGDEVVFPGGYADIFGTLRGDYTVRLSNRVERIAYEAGVVNIHVSGAGTETFDAAIVTVPLGVLKKGDIQFDPPLPEKKTDAVSRLGMGTLDKVYLQFEEAFWDRDVTWIVTPENDLPQGQFNGWLNLDKYVNAPVIMAFNGGPPALDLAPLSDEEIVDRALHTLELAYPG